MLRDTVWKPLNRPEFGLTDAISDVIRQQEWKEPDALTSIRRGPTLILTSDYGGDHKGSQYESLSFLIADFIYCWLWDEFRQKIRKDILGDSRRISFKALNDKRRGKALVPFLRATNTIPGLLITFLIDKKIARLFSESASEDNDRNSIVKLGKWNQRSFSKLSRIGHLGAMLVACMSAPSQNLIWITDEDEIAPNVEKLTEATKLIGHYLNHYCSSNMGHFRFGTTKVDNGSMQLEDLTAIPDLAAGSMAEILGLNKNQGISLGSVHIPLPKGISRKAHAILGWLADGGHLLRKLVVCVDRVEDKDAYNIKLLSFFTEGPIAEYDWRYEADEYFKDKIIYKT
jgi:hypothetical protein